MLRITIKLALIMLCSFLLNNALCSNINKTDNFNRLDRVQVIQDDQKIRLIFDSKNELSYRSSQLENPFRIILDFDRTVLKAKLPEQINLDQQILKGIRSSNHEDKFLRIVIDLNQKVSYETHIEKENNQFHLIADLKKNLDKLVAEDLPEPVPVRLVESNESQIEIKKTSNSNSRNIVIIIDPGHGGKDPGAAGPHGTKEKDVVLSISKHLQNLINQEPGFNAVLTRATDLYIPLRKRLAIARKNHADMFIAVHADAYIHGSATGASVYALSQRGATSEAARWLAEKENESELGGLGLELADKDAILRSVLIDLSQTHTIESSLQIGNSVLQEFGKFSPLHHSHVEQAAFVVLKSPDIPSILVETGFLSNPNEEVKLSDLNYQHQAALAIKQGIKRYFEINPPSDTWFSERHSRKHLASKNLEK